MNGAKCLVQTLVNTGVDVCFTNPGTSEMHFVTSLDGVEGIRPVLGLFEGVVTGAADGYGRMAGKPAATLLHLGPGLANGLANLHNAKRARSPIVNIVGDHATFHKQYDAPLQSDVEGTAGPVSDWVRTVTDSASIAADAADAVTAACGPPGGVSTLILPADLSWSETSAVPVERLLPRSPRAVASDTIDRLAKILSSGESTLLLIKGEALLAEGLAAASRVAEVSGAQLYCDTFVSRIQRGVGRAKIWRLPYFGEAVVKKMAGVRHLILIGAQPPVSFFAYPGKPSWLVPDDCEVHVLAEPDENATQALQDLAGALNAAPEAASTYDAHRPELLTGSLTPASIAATVGAFLPENAVVSDESGTSGGYLLKMTAGAPTHDWMFLTGGSIGQGLPLATGAAIACPDRKVVCLSGDGGAMYTIQSLWTQAREKLDVTTVIFSNRRYSILQTEFQRVGITDPGLKAQSVTRIDKPTLNFQELARGMGVNADRATTADEFNRLFEVGMKTRGPYLIEAVL
ncbi:acetolactate synthase large subunit [bacterium]|nr:acetolactate synthase large subunit [bacterium]